MLLSRRSFVGLTALLAGTPLLPAASGREEKPPADIDLHDWDAVRGLFDLAPGRIHAGLFYLASSPRPVREAVEEFRARLDADPVGTVDEGAFGPAEKNLELGAIEAVARYIGASADDITLTNSTTHGLAVAYHGLNLKAGDEILNTEHDHFVQLETARLVCERTGATRRRVRLFPGHDASRATASDIVERLREAISPATRVLGVTWVHSSCGLKLPLREIAAAVAEVNARRATAQRVALLVDGVHGLGADDPAVASTGVDIFVSGLHKWMLAPRGTGFVWARPEVWERMLPAIASFSSEETYEAWLESKPVPRPFKASYFGLGGFQAYEHLWAIPAAVRMHEAIGPERVASRIQALNGRAREELAKMPHVSARTPRDRVLSAGITAFEVEGHSAVDVVEMLGERRVIATASPYEPSYARLSFGLANSEADVEGAVAAVRALRRG